MGIPPLFVNEYFEGLLALHKTAYACEASQKQAAGYKKIARQFERFVVQGKHFQNLGRGKAIVQSVIPQICSEHDLDSELVRQWLREEACAEADSGLPSGGSVYSFWIQSESAGPEVNADFNYGCLGCAGALVLATIVVAYLALR